jgi:nucleoside-diphosphate-sugar epimerase
VKTYRSSNVALVSKLAAYIGFKPNTPIEEGVRKFVEWYVGERGYVERF